MTISDVASITLAVATIFSLLYISRQVRVTRQQTKGQFILALDDQFDKSTDITIRLANEPDFKPVGKDWPEVWQLMSVYERINIMLEDRILDVGIIDRLYGFRLLIIIANDAIYQRLQVTGAEWQDFIDLCYAIADHRQRQGASRQDAAFIQRVQKLDKRSRRLRNPWRF
jgi:hypothetical protein